MVSAELTSLIINRLSDAVPPNDIILEICNQTGFSWTEAEVILKQVQTENEQVITKRQSPLLTLLAFTIFAGGVVLLAYAIYMLVLTTSTYTSTLVNPWNLANILYFVFNYAAFSFSIILFAIGMIIGSLLGMRDVWASILNL